MLDILEKLFSVEDLTTLLLREPTILELDTEDFNKILDYLKVYALTPKEIANILEHYPKIFDVYPEDIKNILEIIYHYAKEDTKFVILDNPQIMVENPSEFRIFCQKKAKNTSDIESLIEEFLEK